MNLVDSTSFIKCLQFTIFSIVLVIFHIVIISRNSSLPPDCGHTPNERSCVSPMMLDSVGLALGVSGRNYLDMKLILECSQKIL